MSKPLTMGDRDRGWVVSEDVVFRDLGGEAILLHLTSGDYYGLNETASRMWSLLCASGDSAEVLATLEQEYDSEPTQLAQELEAFLADLQAKNLVART